MKNTVCAALFAFAVWAVLPAPAYAKEPVEVTADNALEWDRAKSVFVARGKAVAVQGDTSVKADTLTASYTDGDQGMTVNSVRGKGNSILKYGEMTGYGNNAFYDMDKGYAELTGGKLRVETENSILTAHEKITYHASENKVRAIGKVEAKNPDETLFADDMTAMFKTDSAGNMVLDKIHATGNVVMKTATETLYGDKGDYNVIDKTAVVTGNVRIEKDKNIITGERAEFDMKTNISTMTAPGENGRVKGIFYPSGDK